MDFNELIADFAARHGVADLAADGDSAPPPKPPKNPTPPSPPSAPTASCRCNPPFRGCGFQPRLAGWKRMGSGKAKAPLGIGNIFTLATFESGCRECCQCESVARSQFQFPMGNDGNCRSGESVVVSGAMDGFTQDNLAAAFAGNRQRLLALAGKWLNPVLLKRMGAEDVLSEAYVNAAKRLDYFAARDDVPLYFKLRTVLAQTVASIERRHLKAQRRDAYRELPAGAGAPDENGGAGWAEIPADVTSPRSRLDRDERHDLLRRAIATLPENDRAILVMRHFDGMGNAECAAVLGVAEKAASIRYVRALERLRQKLLEVSCFGKN